MAMAEDNLAYAHQAFGMYTHTNKGCKVSRPQHRSIQVAPTLPPTEADTHSI